MNDEIKPAAAANKINNNSHNNHFQQGSSKQGSNSQNFRDIFEKKSFDSSTSSQTKTTPNIGVGTNPIDVSIVRESLILKLYNMSQDKQNENGRTK